MVLPQLLRNCGVAKLVRDIFEVIVLFDVLGLGNMIAFEFGIGSNMSDCPSLFGVLFPNTSLQKLNVRCFTSFSS